MSTVMKSKCEEYQINWILLVLGLIAFWGLPIVFGSILYVIGSSAGEAMFGAAGFVVVPICFFWAIGNCRHHRMIRAIGRPFESGERVQVTCGRLKDKTGVVKIPGKVVH